MRAACLMAGMRAGDAGSASSWPSAVRSQISTVVPTPGSLRMRAAPPDCCAMPYTWLRPRPVPFTPLVVKKGSNTLATRSGAMPSPLSVTAMRT